MEDPTNSVATISVETIEDQADAKQPKPYSKSVIALSCLAILGAVISAYIRTSSNTTVAESISESSNELVLNDTTAIDTPEATAKEVANESASAPTDSDRALFDSGEEHLKSSRWVLMMREFCAIPQTSAYFLPAQRHVEQLSTRHQTDIQAARDIVQLEKGQACLL